MIEIPFTPLQDETGVSTPIAYVDMLGFDEVYDAAVREMGQPVRPLDGPVPFPDGWRIVFVVDR